MTAPYRKKLIEVALPLPEINDASFPELTRNQVQSYLKQLRSEELIHPSGPTKAARWFPGPQPDVTGGEHA